MSEDFERKCTDEFAHLRHQLDTQYQATYRMIVWGFASITIVITVVIFLANYLTAGLK